MQTRTRPPFSTADRHRLIAEVSLALSLDAESLEEASLETTFERFAGALVPGFAARCAIHLINQDGSARLVALRDAQDSSLTALEIRHGHDRIETSIGLVQAEELEPGEPLERWLILKGQETSFDSSLPGLIVPMRARGQTLGLIALGGPCADADALSVVARLAALAVDGAQLRDAQERSLRALARAGESAARLRSVANALLESTNSESLAQVIIDQGFSGLGASFGMVALLEDEQMRVLWSSGQPEPTDGLPPALRDALLEAAHGEAVWLESREQWSNLFPRSQHSRAVPSALVAIPMRLGRRAVGVLAFGWLQARRFPSEARHFLTELTRQCAGALERTELIMSLETERANLEAVLQQMPSAVVIAEAPSGKLLLANRQVEEIWRQPFHGAGESSQTSEIWTHWLGFQTGAVNTVGPGATLTDGGPLETHRWPLARAIQGGETVIGEEIEILRGDGSWGAISANAAPITNAAGQVIAGVMAFSDVTERRRAEIQLRELNLTLEKRVEERTHELELRHSEMESFVYTASHDLRSPLLAIQSLTYLMDTAITNNDEVKLRELLVRVNRRIEKMGKLLEDLLTLSKVGIAQEEHETFDLGEIVVSVLSDLESQMIAARMKVDMPKSWPLVTYTRSQAYQLLLNLIGNALKYAGRPGLPPRVELSWAVAAGEEHIILRVKDNGPGIPLESREHVFGLFHKLDANSNGTGVGLSIVKRITERHGGRVWIEGPPPVPGTSNPSTPGSSLRLPNIWGLGGATFAVTLPTAKS
jgi:signal transduction histidine kinase